MSSLSVCFGFKERGREAPLPTGPRIVRVASILTALLSGTCMVPAQSPTAVEGEWVAVTHRLANGEYDKDFFKLKQQGSTVTGRFHTLGWGTELHGTIANGHMVLYAAYDPSKPFAQADVQGQDLKVTTSYGEMVSLRPATPADEPAAVPYIAPPPLRALPSNGLAKTPPMGWNSWNKFAGAIDDATVRQIADAMVRTGMRDAGYVYLNLDDSWEGSRDKDGVLQPNSKFPDMKALAVYVHSRGLKLGIYSSPGPRTCGAYPGSYGHEDLDARTWAGWGIDYLKYDWCTAETVYKESDLQAIYQRMGQALQATGRPMVYSLCEYGEAHVERWGPQAGANLWRTAQDIQDNYASMADRIGFDQGRFAPYAGPGHWNDPDMLEVGNGHMTGDEYRTHMSLWSLLAAPLLAGNDLRDMTPETSEILLNKEVIAIDQDSKGVQGTRLFRNGDEDVWTKALANGDTAVGVFNRGTENLRVALSANDLGIRSLAGARDLWRHAYLAGLGEVVAGEVPAHGVLMLRISSAP